MDINNSCAIGLHFVSRPIESTVLLLVWDGGHFVNIMVAVSLDQVGKKGRLFRIDLFINACMYILKHGSIAAVIVHSGTNTEVPVYIFLSFFV